MSFPAHSISCLAPKTFKMERDPYFLRSSVKHSTMEKRMKALQNLNVTLNQQKQEQMMQVMAQKGYLEPGQGVSKKALINFMRKNKDQLLFLAGVDQLPNYSRSSKEELIEFCVMKANACHVDNVDTVEEM